jgi:glycine betaine/proline transport system substrate-binding protein
MQLKIATAFATTLAFATPSLAQDVVVGVPNWPSVTVTANVIKQVVETNMGLKVELQTGTNPVIFEAMDKGSMHIHPEVWLPNQQGLVDQFAAKLELNGKVSLSVEVTRALSRCAVTSGTERGNGRGNCAEPQTTKPPGGAA